MPWYKVKHISWWKTGALFLVTSGIFFVLFMIMVEVSGVKYRLCEVSYTITGGFVPYRAKDDFSNEAITKNLSSTFDQELFFRRQQETNISIFSPQEILSETKLSNLDIYLRTNYSHVQWSVPKVRVVPQLDPLHRLLLTILMAVAMSLGMVVAFLLRRK